MFAEKFIGENKHFRFLSNCIKNVWLVGVVTQNFHPHTHLAIPFYTSAPPIKISFLHLCSVSTSERSISQFQEPMLVRNLWVVSMTIILSCKT